MGVQLVRKIRYPLLLLLCFTIAEIFVNPLGEFALNDDWSYAKSVKLLVEEGKVHIGDWTSTSLLTHLLWGALFVKCFGFSLIVLRFSTLVMSMACLLLFYWFTKKLGLSPLAGFMATLLMLFNPLYFTLSNTFMTDITFFFLLLSSIVLAYLYFKEGKLSYYLLLCVTAVLAILTRQFGIICGAAFFAVAVIRIQQRWKNLLLGLLLLALQFTALRIFESHLSTYIVSWSPYPVAGTLKVTDKAFLSEMYEAFRSRYHFVILQVLFFTGPLSMFYLKYIWIRSGKFLFFLLLSVSAGLTYLLQDEQGIISGNIVNNMTLGPEVFNSNWLGKPGHNTWSGFMPLTLALGYVLCTCSILAFLSPLLLWLLNLRHAKADYLLVFCVTASALYFVLLWFNTRSLFDRYQVPLILLGQLIMVRIYQGKGTQPAPAILPLILFVYVSVAGTRDYLQVNRLAALAYQTLRLQGVPGERINAGYELNCWNEGKPGWLADVARLDDFDYLIQFIPEKDFVPVLRVPFTRYYPYRQDNLYIFARYRHPSNQSAAETE